MATEAPTAEAPVAPDTNLAIEVPDSATVPGGDDRTVSINLADIPANARLELLKAQVREIVRNRVNVANVRRNKERAPFLAWAAYEAAQAADPMQTAVAKPDGEKPTGEAPASLDTMEKAGEAIADLLKGEIRSGRAKGEGKSRAPKDPLVAAVTPIVVKAVYDANKGTKLDDGKGGQRTYTYPDAVKAVGGDGVAYLNAQIDAKVATGADRAALEKALNARYLTRRA
jgi:hypothetical protein